MVAILTDVGKSRSLNEDFASYIEKDDYGIYVVADGMGGHNAGEVASRMASVGIVEYVYNHFDDVDKNKLLRRAVKKVNTDIFNNSKESERLNGMGTTITACMTFEDKIQIANVGDSSCFGIKNNYIVKLTKDHSLVQELLDAGSISEQQASKHPKKNIITRAVGTSSHVDVDIFQMDKDEFDIYMLCTDGLTNELSKKEILEIIHKSSDLDEACNKLVELAKYRGGKDNITVLLFGGEKI
ncbi:MAG: Stp1/IreP family PP2C-type Ser/Thr phosphatase [Clostridium sp.]